MDQLTFWGEGLFYPLLALLLVCLNGVFVATEFALVRIRKTRLEELVGNSVLGAKNALVLVQKMSDSLSAIQLGITLLSLGLGWIGERFMETILRGFSPSTLSLGTSALRLVLVGLSFFFLTLLHVVLGELVPKMIAIQFSEKIVLLFSPFLHGFRVFTKPFMWLFSGLAHLMVRPFGYQHFEEAPLTETELKLMMRESRDDGVISDSEAQIINRAFEFSDRRAIDLMVPAEKVDFLSMARRFEENMAVVKKNKHTRFPVCAENFSSVIGVAHMKDVWPELLLQFSNEAFHRFARPPIFVNAGLRQDQLLRLFQSARGHLAVVRDNHGNNLGIVTLEDVMETLVGEIRDEHGN